MELNVFWGTLLRRWYLVVVGLVCSIAATFYVVDNVGPTYTAEGSALLFPPVTTVRAAGTGDTQGNPYLLLGGLSQARDVVIRALTSRTAREDLEEQHPGATFEAIPDYTTSGPIILVTVEAESQADAVGALHQVLGQAEETLAALQTDLDLQEAAKITVRELTGDRTAEVVRKDQIRGGIVAGALAMALSLLLIGLFDGMRNSRRSVAAAKRRLSGENKLRGGRAGARVKEAEPRHDSITLVGR